VWPITGTYGKVKLAQHQLTGHSVAVKIVDKIHAPTVVREIETWRCVVILAILIDARRLKHPHIVQLYEIVLTETQIMMVMEHCSGGELFDFLTVRGRLDESVAKSMFRQLVLAIQHCHSLNFVHRFALIMGAANYMEAI
jgi:serine/threonine protein kinase